ncbi:parallel beta-helix repeat-containing protein [Thermochaetoides thermophila DSM 1495]|uniref:Parallel beta-helix repeat-containing protein n=1 Tax=Chaetomium thermophilum (strain DSM 1495 / CBS 144.50 / IMI 039719) TaxID=759272 RepID=G0S9D4_CHATD|nr:parallel beta-helix repeat-containing protein [Thermochaetoides thermophila DSM 1495]EGS20045.1 parallel beta-helix repeat-containing protein [Thermochaetoides thermophila DSM 1495]
MKKVTTFLFAALLPATALSQSCGSGNPDIRVTSSGNNFVATRSNGAQVYSGSDYRQAIQSALDSISYGQRVVVTASGSIGASTITISSGKTLEVCGTINVGYRAGRGAIESTNTNDVSIPYLTMTGNPYFGLRFSGTRNLKLGKITMNLSGGLGIRFDRDAAQNYNVLMDEIRVTGAGSHAVETWNIDGLQVGSVIARNVGECGLLLQKTTNARVGLVDGENVATGNGYATFRMANENGKLSNGQYTTNVYVDRVVSRGGGRGIFCVSQSGGAEINNVDLANNGNNAILIENCYNVKIKSGTVNGGGEVRLAARSEFANNRDISLTLTVNNNSVREQPCGTNIQWNISGNAKKTIC